MICAASRRADSRRRAQHVVAGAAQAAHAAGVTEHGVGEIQGAGVRLTVPSTIASSSLSPSAIGPSRCSFSRGRSCGATVFIVHHPCYTPGRCLRLAALLCALALCAACSEPPQKEIDRAQGSIDAARAAGAEQYAAAEIAAATTSLQQAHEAVDQRDYRLALSRAVDASEHAQEAAKEAADGKARARSEAESAIHSATAAIQSNTMSR